MWTGLSCENSSRSLTLWYLNDHLGDNTYFNNRGATQSFIGVVTLFMYFGPYMVFIIIDTLVEPQPVSVRAQDYILEAVGRSRTAHAAVRARLPVNINK